MESTQARETVLIKNDDIVIEMDPLISNDVEVSPNYVRNDDADAIVSSETIIPSQSGK